MKSVYINDFQIHSNSQNLGYVITGIEGVGFPGLRLSRYSRAGESGSIVSNLLYDGRRIALTGVVFSDVIATYEQRRRALENALGISRDANAVSQALTLKFTTMDDLVVQIPVYLQEIDVKFGQLNGMEFLIDLYAPDPAFLTQAATVTSLSRASGGGAVYPLIYPAVYDAGSGGQLNITNNGTMETYPIVYLNGPLTNPIIQNITVGRYIQLNMTITSGEQVTIDMKNKTIVKNGTQSVIANKVAGSLFWWLDKGVNLIKFQTADNTDSGNAQVEHRDAYVGL